MSLRQRTVVRSGTVNNTFLKGLDLGPSNIQSVSVDNYSYFWINIRPEGIFVPPLTVGYIFNTWVGSASLQFYNSTPSWTVTPIISGNNVPGGGNGDVVIGIYDSFLAPSLGQSLNTWSPVNFMRYGGDVGTIESPSHSIAFGLQDVGLIAQAQLELWAGGEGNERSGSYQVQMPTAIAGGFGAVLAGVWTTLIDFVNQGGNYAINKYLLLTVSTDTTGLMKVRSAFDNTNIFAQILAFYIGANLPVVIPFPLGGYRTRNIITGPMVAGQSLQIQINHSVNANVAISCIATP